VRFVLIAPDGTILEVSAQASAQVGLVQGPEIAGNAVITQIVSATAPATTFLLGSIWINTSNGTYNVLQNVSGTPTWVKREWDTAAIAVNAITANQIAAQAITSKFLTGEIIRTGSSPSARIEISAANGIEVFRDATNRTFHAKPNGEVIFGSASVGSGGATVIDGASITTGTITGRTITGGTIEGARIETRAGGSRIRLDDDVTGPFGTQDAIEFVSGGASKALISYVAASNSLDFYADAFTFVKRDGSTGAILVLDGELTTNQVTASSTCLLGFSGGNRAVRIASDGRVFSFGIDDNTTGNAANVRVGASAQLLKSTSTQRIKTDIRSLGSDLLGVSPEKISDELPSVHPYDVLDVAAVEFESLADADDHQRILGFVAENVAEVFPWAAEWDDDGQPSAVADRPIVAALLTVVKEQQATIEDLTARIEALEAN
jgi:hypothetical protein